jgi:hypothetical protein
MLVLCANRVDAQVWKDDSGKYEIEAEFVDFRDGNVRLRKSDVRVISVPIKRLSAADEKFVQQLVRAAKPKPTPAKTPDELVAMYEAARGADVQDAKYALIVEPYVQLCRRFDQVRLAEAAVSEKLAELVRTRFGKQLDERDFDFATKKTIHGERYKSVEVVDISPPDEETGYVELRVEVVPRPGLKISFFRTAVETKSGWKLVPDAARRMGADRFKAHVEARSNNLKDYQALPSRIREGDIRTMDDLNSVLLEFRKRIDDETTRTVEQRATKELEDETSCFESQ